MRYYLIRKNKETGRVWKAICEEQNGKYVVKAGSIISDVELLGCPKMIQQIRRTAKIDENRVLLEDVTFDALDHAASFVLATNAWGKREFKKESDMSLDKRLSEFESFNTNNSANQNVKNQRWVDSIVEAFNELDDFQGNLTKDIYERVYRIRQNRAFLACL